MVSFAFFERWRCFVVQIMSTIVQKGACVVNVKRPFTIVRCSPEFAAFFGYAVDELINKSINCLCGTDMQYFENMIESGSHGRKQVDWRALKKHGHVIHVKVILSAQPDASEIANNATVVFSLCESWEYATSEDYSCTSKLQDSVLDSLNVQRSMHQGCTRDCIVQVESVDDTCFDHQDDLEQIREGLRLVISKASCKVKIYIRKILMLTGISCSYFYDFDILQLSLARSPTCSLFSIAV